VGYIRWTGKDSSQTNIFQATAGRFENPWLSTDLIWYNDLTFEGVYGNYRFNLGSDPEHRKDLYATFGGFPLTNFSAFDPNASNQQKWLYAGQIGADFRTENDSRIRFGAAYYDFSHTAGIANTAPGLTNYNWTAPAFVQKGNTLFNIANPTTGPNQLFALASNYRIVDLIAATDFHVLPRYSVGFQAEALRNIGYSVAQVQAREGFYVPPRNKGYRADINFGSSTFGPLATWRASVGYRYLQRDAVVDAFNDEDFHLGGTDAKGETFMVDFSFNPHVWVRLKYMEASAIDGPPLNIDVWQLDLNSRF
jgi:putative porin